MRISYLQEFVVLCERLNFNEAAGELHISQSALSKHVRALEDDLGISLFERDRYHVVLTSQGEAFRAVAHDIVRMYDGIRQAFRSDAQNENRLIIGGLVDSPGLYSWIVGACSAIAQDVPDFSPHFVPVSTTPAILQVMAGDIDCALATYDPADYPGEMQSVLGAIRIAECEVCGIVSTEGKFASKETLTCDDLQDQSFVRMINPRMTSGWKAMEVFLRQNGIRFKTKEMPMLSVYDAAALPIGDAILLLPCTDVQPNLAHCSSKKRLQLDVDTPTSPLDLVFRKDRMPRMLHRFIEELKKTPL